jgi:hypothetical protein
MCHQSSPAVDEMSEPPTAVFRFKTRFEKAADYWSQGVYFGPVKIVYDGHGKRDHCLVWPAAGANESMLSSTILRLIELLALLPLGDSVYLPSGTSAECLLA